jgi:hypothetical protein
LKDIECDVYSTPILESRTRKGILKGSTSSIATTANVRGQDEKKSFIKKINTLQDIVDGNKAISVKALSPMMNNRGSSKLKAKPTIVGMDALEQCL